jgi:hypothetical protein
MGFAGLNGRAVYGRSPAEMLGSNRTGGMNVCCEVEVSATS